MIIIKYFFKIFYEKFFKKNFIEKGSIRNFNYNFQ